MTKQRITWAPAFVLNNMIIYKVTVQMWYLQARSTKYITKIVDPWTTAHSILHLQSITTFSEYDYSTKFSSIRNQPGWFIQSFFEQERESESFIFINLFPWNRTIHKVQFTTGANRLSQLVFNITKKPKYTWLNH